MPSPQHFYSLHHRPYEEQQRRLARLRALAERLRVDEQRLRAEIQQVFANWLVPEPATDNPLCARAIIARHSKLARTLASVEGRIAAAEGALATAATKLKLGERGVRTRSGDSGRSMHSVI